MQCLHILSDNPAMLLRSSLPAATLTPCASRQHARRPKVNHSGQQNLLQQPCTITVYYQILVPNPCAKPLRLASFHRHGAPQSLVLDAAQQLLEAHCTQHPSIADCEFVFDSGYAISAQRSMSQYGVKRTPELAVLAFFRCQMHLFNMHSSNADAACYIFCSPLQQEELNLAGTLFIVERSEKPSFRMKLLNVKDDSKFPRRRCIAPFTKQQA